jgi:hypothetical protein
MPEQDEDMVDIEYHAEGGETIHESEAGTTQAYREWIGTETIRQYRETDSAATVEEPIRAEYYIREEEPNLFIDPSVTGATGVVYANHSMCGEPGHYCPTGTHIDVPLEPGGSY